MSRVLVINSGSSSLKYQLIELDDERMLASGLIDRIGEPESAFQHVVGEARHDGQGKAPDHTAAFSAMLDAFRQHGPSLDEPPVAIGHRVVHGGERYREPTRITGQVKRDIDELSRLAPLHNPPNLAGIVAAESAFPQIPQVAVFDTAFHQTLSPDAYTYPIDRSMAASHGVRRYGFHGISHQFVSAAAAAFLHRPLAELRLIVLHIGNGASATAVSGGRSVETSMGMTPLEGLMMGTRGGDIDPGALIHLQRSAGMDVDDLDRMLNHGSGLLGLGGYGDIRDVQREAAAGSAAAALAFDVYVHRIKHYVGAYLAHLGGADAIVFTAGVGQNNAEVRSRSLAGLEELGIQIDARRNVSPTHAARVISTEESSVKVLVIPTNEELEIARQALSLVAQPTIS